MPSDEDISNCKERPSSFVESAITVFRGGTQVYVCKVELAHIMTYLSSKIIDVSWSKFVY